MSERVIWKFPIPVQDHPKIVNIPRTAVVQFVGIDPATGEPAAWVELDPHQDTRQRKFRIVGTGHPIEGDGGYPSDRYVGSVIQGGFVWHIYEVRT